MPWQIAPGLIVICGAFTVTGVLLKFTDQIAYGRHRRVLTDEYIYRLDNRDNIMRAKAKQIINADAGGHGHH